MDGPYGIGGYLTVWPNLMMNVFPGAFLAMWVEPLDATTTRVERRLFVRPEIDDDARKSIIVGPRHGARSRRRHLQPRAAIAQRRPRLPTACWRQSKNAASTSSTNTCEIA